MQSSLSEIVGSAELRKREHEKNERKLGRRKAAEPVIISLNGSFRYTSFWYTLWLGRFDRVYQHSQSGSFLSLRKLACGVHAREIDEYKITSVLNECLRDFPHIGVLRKEQKTCIVNLGNTSFLVEKMCMQSCRPASVLPERVAVTEQSQEEVIIKREELRAPVQTHIIFRKTSWS